ncbi:hypothetical protein D3C87_145300 [compost metagenome]
MTASDHKDSTLAVRKALLSLQKELLDALKDQFQKESGREVPPAEWLQVLMMSQRYLWMRELTTLIADIDLLTEIDVITEEQASTARHEVERMLFNSDEAGDFQKQYKNLLKAGPHLMLHHGHLKTAVNPLPKSTHTDEAAAEKRKSWHETHRQQARKKRN